MSSASHTYFDGQSARARSVGLRLGQDGLALLDDFGVPIATWPQEAIRVVSENAVNKVLTLRVEPDEGQRLQVQTSEDRDALRARYPSLRKWRSRERMGLLKGFLLWGTLGVVLCALLYVGWARAAILLADAMPDSWEQHLGDMVQTALIREGRVCANPAGQRELDALGGRMRPARLQGKSLTIIVVKGDIPNAFAIPGRRIVLFSGLIDLADDADMLAGVLAHEMAHAELRHPIRGVVHQLGVGSVIGLLFGDSTIASAGQIALALSYTRDIEREADARGVEILREAGLRADGLSRFLDKIDHDKSLKVLLPDFLSTHPDLPERVAATAQPATGETAMSGEAWTKVRAMCTKP